MQQSLTIEDDSLDRMTAAGYIVKRNPQVLPSDGVNPKKEPDGRLGGHIADVYAPITRNLQKIRNRISDKVKERQAFHIIVNLSRVEGITPRDIAAILNRQPVNGLRELFTIERNGTINRILPETEQVAGPDNVYRR